MIRHQRRPTLFSRAAALAAAALFCGLLAPRAARAQSVQVAINAAFVETGDPAAGRVTATGTPIEFIAPIAIGNGGWVSVYGNISNDPEIQFESNGPARCNITPGTSPTFLSGGALPSGTVGYNFCNDRVFLCTQVAVAQNVPSGQPLGTVQIDQLEFEIFRYVDGANPLDPSSTPPLRTFFIDNPGSVSTATGYIPDQTHAVCVLWDGSQPIQGGFGKIDGNYGFRVTVQTNQVGQSGNITITATRAYPSGATQGDSGAFVSQKAITVDVTNVHVVRSTPTVVGQITGVSAEPYNFTYRLSKDATMYLTVNSALPDASGNFNNIRNVVPGLPRTGEGVLATASVSPLINGDSWDGRDNLGNLMPAGQYLAVFQANSIDQYTRYNPGLNLYGDLSDATTTQIGIDPLQITDIRVQPLLGGSTSLAVLSYMLTEAATVYVDVYPPGTQFCNGLNSVGDPTLDGTLFANFPAAKNFSATLGACGSGTIAPLRTISQQQTFRTPVISFWDGRDSSGNLMNDGDYVFVIYAALPSQKGANYGGVPGNPGDKRIWTSIAKTGFVSVLRGLVGITQITPTSTIIGSSPPVAGLNPFTFRYQLSRDAIVSMKVFDASGLKLIKTVLNQETRPGLFNNAESWDGTNDSGLTVSSGTYLAQLTATDPTFPAKVSTTTALFPVNLFRITDVGTTPLLAGASDQVLLTYQLSQPMFVAWNIYPAGSVVVGSTATWPPCPTQSPPSACTSSSVVNPAGQSVNPVVSFHGLRPGRLKITEFWDGRDVNGLFVPDGSYVFTLTAQSTTTPPTFATDRVYGNVTVARGAIIFQSFNVTPDVPQLFNSSNTITLDPFTIAYTLSRQSSVTIQVLNTSIPPQVVRTLVSGSVRQNGILQTDVWDGRDDRGNFPAPGFYLVRAVANDVASLLSSGSTAQITISYDPLRIYDLAITPMRTDSLGAVLAYQVSEPMKVAIKIYRPGTNFDSSGNPSPPDAVSLVRRIVGMRPARTQVQDTWDGRDFRLAFVPDGTYKFKIVGSTDPTAIDDITGNILNPAVLAEDRLIDDIPVAVNGALNPKSDFEGNTFSYPNPAETSDPNVCFHTFNPFTQSHIFVKLYNMAGDLVATHDFGNIAGSFSASTSLNPAACSSPGEWLWGKVNDSGRGVARGLYYAVFRVEETEGGANVLQTVKKVLIK